MHSAWTTTTLDGKTLDLFDPPAPPRGGVIFLHAYDERGLRDNAVYTALLAEHQLACCCAPGGPYWWVDRPCPGFHPELTPEAWLLERVAPLCRTRWKLGARALGLLGFSMGGQAALRLAFRNPEAFAVVAALAPAIEYHQLYGAGAPLDELYESREQCRQDTAPMHIQPGRAPAHLFFACDPDDEWWFRGADRLREKLVALGVEHECDLATRAGGHGWPYADALAARALRFVADGLQRQALRLM